MLLGGEFMFQSWLEPHATSVEDELSVASGAV